jgi:hypothetical protein
MKNRFLNALLSDLTENDNRWNSELATPIEYLIELARSEAANRMQFGEAVSLPVSSVVVEDDADMRRYGTSAHLPKQSAFVGVIEDFLH